MVGNLTGNKFSLVLNFKPKVPSCHATPGGSSCCCLHCVNEGNHVGCAEGGHIVEEGSKSVSAGCLDPSN